jgi:phosphatidylglycerophosphatase A
MSAVLAKLISSLFFIGYIPVMPGTFGSLAGLGIFFLVRQHPAMYCGMAVLLLIGGLLCAGEAERLFKQKDSSRIVIDEAAGMLISLSYLPYNLAIVLAGFFIFRLLDIIKVYPARQLERLRGGFGVMSDDLICGIYTNLILQVAVRVISFKGS